MVRPRYLGTELTSRQERAQTWAGDPCPSRELGQLCRSSFDDADAAPDPTTMKLPNLGHYRCHETQYPTIWCLMSPTTLREPC